MKNFKDYLRRALTEQPDMMQAVSKNTGVSVGIMFGR
jgi:hypothetical protein